MEQNIAKQLVTKDGAIRISIIQDMYPDNPRFNTDEPLHCEDWCRDYTIMGKQEKECKSESARKLLEYLLGHYVDYRKIIDTLVQAGKTEKSPINDKLVYNRSTREWELHSLDEHFDYSTYKSVFGWYVNDSTAAKKDYIDLYWLLDLVTDETIDHLTELFLNDGVKVMQYSIGYYGDISFSNGATCKSDGIAWFEKEEFLKYSGHDEKYWNEHTCMEIDWLHEELEAYGDGEVYGYRVEKRDDVKVHEEHSNGEVKDYDRTDWNETDSCWGFYGEVEKVLPWILDNAGYKMEELQEAA